MKVQKLLIGLGALVFGLGFNFIIAKTGTSFFTTNTLGIPPKTIPSTNKNNVKVALLLDTSGSMNGLIEQAKSQLWQILNELAKTERDGQDPNLQIALYEYGNPSRAKNQILKLSEFTTDMDLISEKLFALTTDGGEEYCGEVITTSINDLEWGNNESDLKMIYIAGNEPFTQGPINYKKACDLANQNSIVVNTIFCGKHKEGINSMWKDGAMMTNGEYFSINQNEVTQYTATPYDKKISDLNSKLNTTYIPYGKKGKAKKDNQIQQDANASSYGSANYSDRAAFKSSKKYKADDWDLVDAYKKDKKILEKVTAVPDTLQNISIEEMEAKIQVIITQREVIQTEIKNLNQKRQQFIDENNKKNSPENNLKNSVRESIKKQAEKKGYQLKN